MSDITWTDEHGRVWEYIGEDIWDYLGYLRAGKLDHSDDWWWWDENDHGPFATKEEAMNAAWM